MKKIIIILLLVISQVSFTQENLDSLKKERNADIAMGCGILTFGIFSHIMGCYIVTKYDNEMPSFILYQTGGILADIYSIKYFERAKTNNDKIKNKKRYLPKYSK